MRRADLRCGICKRYIITLIDNNIVFDCRSCGTRTIVDLVPYLRRYLKRNNVEIKIDSSAEKK
uniref:Uncharacterized protein n=1 Tax=viral metagenome TaxID=1070528 RepID=A0A6H1ZXJ8_9ZZZZ